MPRINFVKHICCCSPSPLLRLQRFLKNLKSEVLLWSKRGSQSCFYRTWKSISLRHQSSTLQRKNVTSFYLRRQIGAIQNYNMLPNRNQPSSSRNKSFDQFLNCNQKIGKNIKGQLYYPIVTNDASSNENLSTSFYMTRKLNSQMFYQAGNKQVRHYGNHPMIFIP